jgi:hypothetical protein
LRVRRNARARNLILRLDDHTGGAVVTIPARTPIREAIHMAERKAGWIAAQLKRRPAPVPFVDGAQILFQGVEHTVCHRAGRRGIVCENGEIIVSGREEHLARRLKDWLKAQAKAEIAALVVKKSQRLEGAPPQNETAGSGDGWSDGSSDRISASPFAPQPGPHPSSAPHPSTAGGGWGGLALAALFAGGPGTTSRPSRKRLRPGRITVRDTRSRWGSCAADGQLNFSWRLILAPPYVLDYVVAHELAHLVHRDHSPAFWALADHLTDHLSAAKAWLNAHGKTLHRYG